MAPERDSERNICHELIEYSVVVLKDGQLRFLDLTGKVINKSKNGICFVTRYPLKSGCVLEFKKGVLRQMHGVVLWIQDIGGIYMAGMRLMKEKTNPEQAANGLRDSFSL